MPLNRIREPFSHPEWLFEVKWDGFRALAYVHRGACKLISCNGNQFKSFPALAEALPAELRAGSAVLDGEIVALDSHGKTQFRGLGFLFPSMGFVRQGMFRCISDLALPDSLFAAKRPQAVAIPQFRNGKRQG